MDSFVLFLCAYGFGVFHSIQQVPVLELNKSTEVHKSNVPGCPADYI
jgi:hypothetical protein